MRSIIVARPRLEVAHAGTRLHGRLASPEQYLPAMSATTLHDPHDTGAMSNALNNETRLGIDTEFMRERTYFAQLCLVQIAINDDVFFVDPLEENDLDEVWNALFARDWVLHSGRQDIEVMYQTVRRMPQGTLFDTQIAAAFAGFPPQIGYAGLVQALFGRELP